MIDILRVFYGWSQPAWSPRRRAVEPDKLIAILYAYSISCVVHHVGGGLCDSHAKFCRPRRRDVHTTLSSSASLTGHTAVISQGKLVSSVHRLLQDFSAQLGLLVVLNFCTAKTATTDVAIPSKRHNVFYWPDTKSFRASRAVFLSWRQRVRQFCNLFVTFLS